MRPEPKPKRRRWPWIAGGFALALVLLVAVFDWNWFKPLVERQASAALGREVTIGRFHVELGWVPRVVAERVVVANPPDWPGGGAFATIERLAVDVDAGAYLRDRAVVIPKITADRPVVEAAQTPEGRSNWSFGGGGGGGEASGPEPRIAVLEINEGRAHVVVPKLGADMNLAVHTRGVEGAPPQLVADAKGTYAGQPISGAFVGGALLTLRDAAAPYPIDLKVENGPTRITLVGTVQNPLNFAGADLQLNLSGPDMARLLPLTGVALWRMGEDRAMPQPAGDGAPLTKRQRRELERAEAFDRARARGWAVEHEQGTDGVACVAVPLDYRIPATDAISCSMPAKLADDDEVERVANALLRHTGILVATLRREGIR